MKKYISLHQSLSAAKNATSLFAPHMSLVKEGNDSKLLNLNGGGTEEVEFIGNNLNDLVLRLKSVGTVIATDETNLPLMQCARANGWVAEGATQMLDTDAANVTSLLEQGDTEALVFGIEGQYMSTDITKFYQINSPDDCNRTQPFEDTTQVTKIDVASYDLTKGMYEDGGVTLSNGSTLRWFDCAVEVSIEGTQFIVPCVFAIDEEGTLKLCIEVQMLKHGYYALTPVYTVTLNDFYQINDPDNVSDYRIFGNNLTEDMITKIDVASIDVTKSVREDGGITLNDGTTLRWWDVAVSIIGGQIITPCVATVNPMTEEEGETLIIQEGFVTPGSALVNYEITNFDEFEYFIGITNITANAMLGISNFPTTLTSIIIPNSVTEIGEHAFDNCSSLTSITIPNSVTSIDGYAFYNCSGLTLVTIGNSVTSIGEHAFDNCSSLTSITIPNSVTSIDEWAFQNCSSLTTITYNGTISQWNNISKDDNWNYNTSISFIHCTDGDIDLRSAILTLNDSSTVNLVNITSISQSDISSYKDTLVGVEIKDSVTSIGSQAFQNCSSLTTITIPDSVTSINSGVFNGCTGLTSITIPNSVTSIDYEAFYNCTSLTSITIPNSVTSIGVQAFRNCTSLTSITIPDSVTSINSGVFIGCSGLTSITIPNSVTSISVNAFYNCSGLASITIPDSVTSIGSGAFYGCYLLSLNYTGIATGSPWDATIVDEKTEDGLAIKDNSVVKCAGNATVVTIPDSVTSIGYDAFWKCSSLISITVDSNNTVYDSRDNCNAIIKTSTNELIRGCQNTVIPDSVTSIDYWAFSNCTGLTSITIPNSITSIKQGAFSGCSGLTSVTISNSITSISANAFQNCSSLTSVTIPDSVTSIGDYAFQNCSSLTSVIIPNSVTSIDTYAFYGCSGLTSITCKATTPPTLKNSNAFDSTNNCPIYVPSNSVNAYKAASNWSTLADRIQAIPTT